MCRIYIRIDALNNLKTDNYIIDDYYYEISIWFIRTIKQQPKIKIVLLVGLNSSTFMILSEVQKISSEKYILLI